MRQENEEWFGTWFDSPYYHILYRDRDHGEAQQFIDNLIDYFKISSGQSVLDLACGKGRHSVYLNKKGFDVVGLDLSVKNIEYAKNFENNNLHFHIHDMRQEFALSEFDFVLNMFTSFGYFDSEKENQQAISGVAKSLKNGGHFLLDFLNPYTVINNLIPVEKKQIDNIEFNISRSLSKSGYLLKDIQFKDNDQIFKFQEKVKAIRRVDFMGYFEQAKMKVINIFGSYELDRYIPKKSKRMIFVVRK